MVLAGLGVGAAWAVLGACGEDDERDAQANGGARLELIMDEPATIDPGLATQPHEFGIVRALFEPLLDIGPGGAPRPAAAASWQITDAGRAYTFKLRPDARWSNGELLSADDFVWAWQRNLNPQVGGAFNYLMFPIRGAERVANGEFQSIDSVDIFAPDPKTLRVRLEQPTPGFLARLAAATFLPLPRAEIEGAGSAWTTPHNIRSNGAHRLAQWDRGVGMTLFRNDHHGGDPSPYREIVVRFPQQDWSLASAFRSSTVHAAQVQGRDYRSARGDLFSRAASPWSFSSTPWDVQPMSKSPKTAGRGTMRAGSSTTASLARWKRSASRCHATQWGTARSTGSCFRTDGPGSRRSLTCRLFALHLQGRPERIHVGDQ